MAKWTFDAPHSAAEFRARHMMVSWVRGHFKNVRGSMDFDPLNPIGARARASIDAAALWSGDPDRDAHLLHADFIDAENHPRIIYEGAIDLQVGENDFRATGELTLRGVTKEVALDITYLGQWPTPWWEDGVDKGPKTRAGFVAHTVINRLDFGVSWNGAMDRGGLVVSNQVWITLDVEALLDEEHQ